MKLYIKPKIIEEKINVTDIVASSDQLCPVEYYPIGHYILNGFFYLIPSSECGFIFLVFADLFNPPMWVSWTIFAVATILMEILLLMVDFFDNKDEGDSDWDD